jgi:outer membrane murein-binding lipoprotein Lpp
VKRAFVALIAAVALVAAGTASSATPTERKVATLQKQVKTLQKQVKTLQKQSKDLREFASAIIAVDVCQLALTADIVQGTWTAMNQFATRSVFASAQTLNDRGACAALRVQRQPTQVPPAISPFSSLLILLTGSSSLAAP